jgi:hypothetical protein
VHERNDNEQLVGPDTAFSGLLTRLERDGMNRRVVSASRDAAGHGRETRLDEPLTPELVLVDPDLARRAREQLVEGVREPDQAPVAVEQDPAARMPLFGFIQPTPSTHVLERRRRSPWRRRGGLVLVLLFLGVAAAVAILRVEPLKHFFWKSREATELRSDVKPSAGVSRSRTVATPKPGPTLQPRGPRETAPSQRSGKTPRRPAAAPATPSARAFAWVAAPHATYYLVQFYRRGDEIFRARPSAPRLLVPAHWTFNGRRYSLLPGRYRWSVRPGYGRPAQARYGQPVVSAKLVIQRTSVG